MDPGCVKTPKGRSRRGISFYWHHGFRVGLPGAAARRSVFIALASGWPADRLEELQGVGQARSGPGAMPGGAAGNDNSVLQKCRVGAVNGQWWDGRRFPSPRLAARIQAPMPVLDLSGEKIR